jgi:hypothetical protein
MIQAALLGGVFIGVLSALPVISLANCCCLWVIGGGLLAAYLTQQNEQARPITVGRGALAGASAGIIGAFVWLIASMALDVVIAPLQQRMLEEMLRSAQDMPPDARAMIESMAGRNAGPFKYVAGFSILLLFGTMFSTLGGVLGATYFRNDVPPALGGPLPPPPLPPQ